MTYRDLLELLQKMDGWKLSKTVNMIGDGYSGSLIRIYTAPCDQVQDEEGMHDITDFDEEELKDMEIVAKKGDVFLLGD